MRSCLPRAVGILSTIFAASLAVAGESLPNFDIRLDADGKPTAAVRAALLGARTGASTSLRELDEQQLLQATPEVRVDDHEFFGTPHFVVSTRAFLTAPQAGGWTARQVARTFVGAHKGLFEIAPSEIDNARVDFNAVSDNNGVTRLIYQQQIGGIDLYGAEMRANVTRNGELINISSDMLSRPTGDFQPAAGTLSALDAIRAAASSVGISMTVDPVAVGAASGANEKQVWGPTPDFRPNESVTSERIYFPLTKTDIRSAWLVLIPEIGIGNTYEIMVDATNGQILRRSNRLHFATTEPMTFRVYTNDSPAPMSPGTPTPSGVQAAFVPQNDVTVNPADISAINPNGWMDDGVNETQGNNVDAHLDRNADDSPDLPRPVGTPYRQFLFTHDPAQAPTVAINQSAAVTQLFYFCNRYHDRLWALGFNEQFKNFQTLNFGRGGTGNDRVQADSQDGSGTNNANFDTGGADGTTGRCQMYIFTGPNPDRDGDLDGDIVYHELSHGLSIRLSNDTVGGTQSGGMGEGWGDYFGISLNAEAGDDPHGIYATGGHTTLNLAGVSFNTNYYFGIRRFPYSTDMTKNPETYADIDTAQQSYPPGVPISPITGVVISSAANEVHNVGEVWCNALLECRAALWDIYGFAGNQMMMQLVVDGLKLQPANPSFLQARSAIIQADQIDNGGANYCTLWAAFAKRGMGMAATSPSGSSSSGIVESYTSASVVSLSITPGTPTQLAPSTPTTFHVSVAGSCGATPTPGTGLLHYSINGAPFVAIAMVETTPGEYDATIPGANCFDVVRYYVSSDSSSGVVNNPLNAPVSFYTAIVYTSSTTTFSDNADANLGWSLGAAGDTATTGQWTRGDPIGTAAQPEAGHSPVNCFFTGQGTVGGALGQADVDGGFTTLISPTLDLSAGGNVIISYWRWYSNDAGDNPNTDTFRVSISNNNGSSWVAVETIGSTFGGEHSGGWVYHEFHPASLVGLTSQMRVRFVAEDNPAGGTGSLIEAAIDDFQIVTRDCQVAVVCTHGDVNNDGFIDGLDIVRFSQILIGGGGTAVENCAGDLGAPANSAIDNGDVANFVNCVLSGGGC